VDELTDNLSGATVFSSLDLTTGYAQFRLQPADIPKTAFNTHMGKFEYTVLPMGLTNAPAVFQREMNRMFSSLLNKCVLIYLDDLLIYSKTVPQHLDDLRAVFAKMREHQLMLKLRKCEFFRSKLKFLGHIVTAGGMYPDPDKIQTVTDWPTPKTVLELRSFLGLANYFRKYIRAYAAITSPLTDLLKGLSKQEKRGKFSRLSRMPPFAVEALELGFAARWDARCQSAFDTLKRALTTAPVLVLPDFGQPFEVVTDACQTPPAVGGVLLQNGRPVAYYSQKLSGPQLNYSVTDLEMLGVIQALREWRCYLEGADFTLVTDHKPNTYLDRATSAHTLDRRARWLAESSGYRYTWEYREGRHNVPDPVSRVPVPSNALVCLPSLVALQTPVLPLSTARTRSQALQSRATQRPGDAQIQGLCAVWYHR